MTAKRQKVLAGRVRDECVQTALAAYENASISGLCGEGAFEAAISAMRMMDINAIVEHMANEDGPEAAQ